MASWFKRDHIRPLEVHFLQCKQRVGKEADDFHVSARKTARMPWRAIAESSMIMTLILRWASMRRASVPCKADDGVAILSVSPGSGATWYYVWLSRKRHNFATHCFHDAFIACCRQKKSITGTSGLEGWRREDGLWDIEGRLTDTKDHDYTLGSGVRKTGESVHDMQIRITIDQHFNVRAAEASSNAVPYPGCESLRKYRNSLA